MTSDDVEVRGEAPAGGAGGDTPKHAARNRAGTTAHSLDQLSLEQALKDVEIANARVIDLTQRLIAAQNRTIELEGLVQGLQAELHELRTRYDQMRNSRAFRMADRYWMVLGALRP